MKPEHPLIVQLKQVTQMRDEYETLRKQLAIRAAQEGISQHRISIAARLSTETLNNWLRKHSNTL